MVIEKKATQEMGQVESDLVRLCELCSLNEREFLALFGSQSLNFAHACSDIDVLYCTDLCDRRRIREMTKIASSIGNRISFVRWALPGSVAAERMMLYELFVIESSIFICGSQELFRSVKTAQLKALKLYRLPFLFNQYFYDDFMKEKKPVHSLVDSPKYGPGGFHQLQFLRIIKKKVASDSMNLEKVNKALNHTVENLQKMHIFRNILLERCGMNKKVCTDISEHSIVSTIRTLKRENVLRLLTVVPYGRSLDSIILQYKETASK